MIALFGNELMLFFVQFVWVWGLFLVRGPFRQFFLGRAYIGGGGLYMDEYLHFESTIFCSSNCNFLRFSAHNLSLILLSFLLPYF